MRLNSHPSGRHFLQIPGPTNVPDRVLKAIAMPTIDHRGPEFGRLGRRVLDGIDGLQLRVRPHVGAGQTHPGRPRHSAQRRRRSAQQHRAHQRDVER